MSSLYKAKWRLKEVKHICPKAMKQVTEEPAIWTKADYGTARVPPTAPPHAWGPWNNYRILEVGSGSRWFPYLATAGVSS